MNTFFDAVRTFFDQLAAVRWEAMGIALGLHFLRISARAPAWRTILAAAFPHSKVPLRTVFGAYWAAVGVNSIVPARGGDAVRAYLIKHRVEGANYATIASTLVVETLLDTVIGLGLLIWALQLGVLPSLDKLPDLPSIDWSWAARHPNIFAGIAVSVVVVAALVAGRAALKVKSFWARVGDGFAILRDRRRFVRGVVSWQLLSWGFRVASVFFSLEAFHIAATFRNAMIVVVVQSVSTLLPFTPGGAGTQQGLLAYVYNKRNIATKSAAISFSVGMFIATTLLNVAMGFLMIGLMLRTLHWRRVVKPEEETAGA